MAGNTGIGENGESGRADGGRRDAVLARMSDNVTIPVAYVDAGLVYRAANKAALAALHADADQVVNVPAARVLNDNVHVLAVIQRTLETGRDFSELVTLEAPEDPGLARQYVVSYLVDRDEHGAVRGLYLQGIDVTESMREVELERQRLQTLVDTMPLAVFVTNAQGGVLYTSEQASEMWGGIRMVESADEYVEYKGWWPETGERLRAEDWPAARALAGETVLNQVIDIERFDGGRATIITSSAPILVGGEVTGAVTASQDVTSQKRHEENLAVVADIAKDLGALSSPEEMLRTVAEKLGKHMNAGMVLFASIDESEDKAVVQHAWGSGTTPDVTGERPLSAVVSERCREAARSGRTIVVSGAEGESTAAEGRDCEVGARAYVSVPLHRDGEWRHLLTIEDSAPRHWRDDEIELIEDVANRTFPRLGRLEAEARLHESEKRFRALVSASSQVLYRMSPDWSEMRQLHSEGFLANTEKPNPNWLHEYIHPDDQGHVTEVIGEAIRSKGVFELEHRVLRADGSLGWTLSRAIPVMDENGGIVEWFGAAADITDRKRAEDELREERERALVQAERAALLRDLAEVAISTVDLVETGRRQLEALQVPLRLKTAYIFVPDEKNRVLVPLVEFGHAQDFFEQAGPILLDTETQSAVVYRTKEQRYIADLWSDPEVSSRTKDAVRELGIARTAVLPLVFMGRAVGVIGFNWDEPAPFAVDEIALLQSVTDEIALGIQNARLAGVGRRELARTQLLKEIASAASSTLDLTGVSQRALQVLQERIEAKAGSIYFLDTSAGSMQHLASFGYPEAVLPSLASIPLDRNSNLGRTVLDDLPYLTDSQVEEIPPDSRGRLKAAGMEGDSWIIVPIRAVKEAVGVLSLVFEGRRPFAEDEVDLYLSVADVLGTSMDNARLHDREAGARRLAEALNRINEELHSSLDFDEIMQRAVTHASEAAGFDGVAVHLREHGFWRFAYSYGLPDDLSSSRLSDEEAPVSVAALERQAPILIGDAQRDERANRELMSRFDIKTLLAVPLLIRGRPAGVLFAGCFLESTTFGEQQVDFMNKVASTLSLALDNARLYMTEHNVAERLQEALLALPEAIGGIDFAHAYHSATEAVRVGGDFYDVFSLNHDHVGITIGDVAGKGLDAAVLTSLVKNTVRAHATERGKTPTEVLHLTNDVVYRATSSESFVTVFFGILDCRDGRLVYANAGHTSAALLKSDGSVSRLSVTGPLLGAFVEAGFDQSEACLARGELLFLFTDGLTEARRDKEFYTEQRLFDVLAGVGDGGPSRVVRMVLDDVLGFTGGTLSDDMALLAIERAEDRGQGAGQQKLEL